VAQNRTMWPPSQKKNKYLKISPPLEDIVNKTEKGLSELIKVPNHHLSNSMNPKVFAPQRQLNLITTGKKPSQKLLGTA